MFPRARFNACECVRGCLRSETLGTERAACDEREYLANGLRKFRVADGHLPDHQPILREVDALRWLDANPFQEIVEILV